jgi:hypoxanthine phosphoribosyltransferase
MTTVTELFSRDQIARRVGELAAEIAGALPREFTVVGVLKGSFVFTADLVRALDGAGRAPAVEFIGLESYGDGRESSGAVRTTGAMPKNLEGRAVLLVDDIADSGRSLARARELVIAAGAGRVWTCVITDKPSRRQVPCKLDFVGFQVPDAFVVGYGLDHAGKYRHLPYIGILE